MVHQNYQYHTINIENNSESGFSLVELSLVFIVIAVIMTGIIKGSDLISSSEHTALISDIRAVQIAYSGFENRYSAIPGDVYNAQDYFGTTANNGDGDGEFDGDEVFYAWQHMAAADFIDDQNYTGTAGSGVFSNINIFKSSVDNVALGFTAGDATDISYGGFSAADRILAIGGEGSSYFPNIRELSASQILSIDQKLDDSLPRSGIVRIYEDSTNAATACISGSDLTTSNVTYNVQQENKCAAILLQIEDLL